MNVFTLNPLATLPLRSRAGRPAPDKRHWFVRPDDLLVLDFAFVKLRVQPSRGNGPAQLVKDGSGQAFLVVTFPPQHLNEIAYFLTVEGYDLKTANLSDPDVKGPTPPLDENPAPPPIQATIAGWSRLVFFVSDNQLPIAWTFNGLLEAMRELELSVPANALPPSRFELSSTLRSILQVANVGIARVVSGIATTAELSTGPVLGSLVAGGNVVIAGVRARRQLRVTGRTFGISEQTGAATRDLHLSLIDDERQAAARPDLLRPEPQPPNSTQSALELPYELFLSPNHFAAWFHSSDPATSPQTGHTELWHTRLGVRKANGVLVDGADELRTLRAVWTTAGTQVATPRFGEPVVPPPPSNSPYRMPLDDFDRHNVVHLSSNFRLADPENPRRFYDPRPLDVDFLALSSLGAWIDSRGVWDQQPLELSVEEWRHRATLGRDHYVRVVYGGFLLPWGHRASVIKVTERRFHQDLPGNPAYLCQRMFLIVREPLKTYRSSGLRYHGPDRARMGEQFDLMMPFAAVRITTRVSPLLDPPEKNQNDIANQKQMCFWPFVGGQPFKFHLVATDVVGNEIEFTMPLIFVGKEFIEREYANSIVLQEAITSYATATWPKNGDLRATVPVFGQRMAFAESAAPDDTTFAVTALTFGAELPSPADYDQLSKLHPRFFPVVRGADVGVPSLQAIARTSQPASVVFASPYLLDGFGETNGGQVFLAADPKAAAFAVKFSGQGDRSGGLITPDLALSGLSRITGPVSGDLATASAGTFSPASWFGAILGAKLFGVLKLSDILDSAGFDHLDKLPQFTGQSLNQVERLIVDMGRLHQRLSVDPVAETSTTSFLIDQLLDPTTGSIPALLRGSGAATVLSQLAALNTELGSLQSTIVGSALPPGPKALVAESAASLQDEIAKLVAVPQLLQQFASGDVLPQSLSGRLEWRPVVKQWGPFKPSAASSSSLEKRNLLLAVEAAGESFTVTCSLDNFVLDLDVVILTFERVQFRARAGKKPEVDVAFTGFAFGGPLSFVETLRELVPFDGFADPPQIAVTPDGITAGFSMGLPNIAIGIFSLENLSLAAGFAVPFVGPPMSTWFRFCERENPARLTVTLFGGGFFFGLTVNADGLQILEGAIEFGAAASVDLGVASGSVSIMAGLYFKIEGTDSTLAGYFRMRGVVQALGIVSVSIELYLEMRYENANGGGKCTGTATISVEVEVAMFSTTVSITCTKKFAGATGDPTLSEMLDVRPDATSADWNAYCAAFA